MFLKISIFIGLISIGVRAGILPTPEVAPLAIAQPVLAKNTEEYDPNPQYSYSYDIQDTITGDSKSQTESRDGDVVRGQYALNDADGFRRTVDYFADPLSGFNAIVAREPLEYSSDTTVIKSYSAAPALIKSQPTGVYSSAPALVTPVELKSTSLVEPTILRTVAPAKTYTTPLQLGSSAFFRTQSLPIASTIKSAPLVYKAQSTGLALPYASGATIVKSSYSSPLVSYSYSA